MLDTQADDTYVTEDTCTKLGVVGVDTHILLTTLSAVNELTSYKKVTGLQVRGYNISKQVSVYTAYTRKSIAANRENIPTPEIAMKWPHLHGIANKLMPASNCEIGLLIGCNYPLAFKPRAFVSGEDEDAFALCTDLGWGIMGVLDDSANDEDDKITHRTVTREVIVPMCADDIADTKTSVAFSIKAANTQEIINPIDLRNLMDNDFANAGDFCDTKRSMEDQKFLNMLEAGVARTADGHLRCHCLSAIRIRCFQTTVVWLKSVWKVSKKRLLNDQAYQEDYFQFMNGIIDKDFAEKCIETTPPEQVWYMPHHSVYHPKKNKIRVVFDANARRFLWWEGDLNEPLTEFRMTVHLFGAKSSPGCANYGLKMAAVYSEEE